MSNQKSASADETNHHVVRVVVDATTGRLTDQPQIEVDQHLDFQGRKYIVDHCMFIPVGDEWVVFEHARQLFRMGLPREWAYKHLRRACDGKWNNSEHSRKTIFSGVYRAYKIEETLRTDLIDKDHDVERFKGKNLAYFESLPPVQWLWDGVLATKSLFVIYGKEKTGKTFFSLSLALAVATRREFCGRKVEWGRVLYIIGEGNEAEFSNRLRAWIKHAESQIPDEQDRDVLHQLIANNFGVVTVPVMVNTESQVRDLLKQNPGEWDLVIVDTLMRNTSGNVNDPRDMADFIRGCDMIREETGAAVIVVHHQGKDERRGAFGSMHLTGACDGAALILAKGMERIFRIKLMRNGDDGQEDFVYRLAPQLVRLTDDGEQTSCYVDFIERRKKGARGAAANADPLDSLLWRIHSEKPESAKQLAEWSRTPYRSLMRDLKRLRERGDLGDGIELTPQGLERARAFDANEDEANED